MTKLTHEDVEQIARKADNKGERIDLSEANMSGIDFKGLEMSMESGLLMDGVPSYGTIFLRGANMRGANLSEANLSLLDLRGVDISEANMSNAYLFGTKLSGSNMSQVNLNGADLRRADLREANLSRANLREANLSEVKLCAANLTEADLFKANLSGSDLSQVDLSRANLCCANLDQGVLIGALFTQTKVGWTSFRGVNLSKSKDLDSILHRGPSTIDIDTIFNSTGKIPGIFLRGIGAPESFITYVLSLIGETIQYYSCFISYSSQDEAFAQRLHADLQQKGVRCWFAPEDMKVGDKIRHRIDESIRIHDKLLLILSENSLNSFWVESEVEKAFEEERQRNTTVLFPVRLDEAVLETNQPWAAEIRRTRHIGDFTRWKDHDAYQQAFERLLRDLKAEG